MKRLRLEIDPVIKNAEQLHERILKSLPGHEGIASIAVAVGRAARDAKSVSLELNRPFSLHRLPTAFLTIATVVAFAWLFIRIQVGSVIASWMRNVDLVISLPDRDAEELRQNITGNSRLQMRIVPGSRESLEEIEKGETDVGFVQGGFPIPRDLPRLATPHPEYVLWFVRDDISDLATVKKVLTSIKNEGSHTVAQEFMAAWNIGSQIEFVHDWKRLTQPEPSDSGETFLIPKDIDAIFVVKDPADDKTLIASTRLQKAGYRLASPSLGAKSQRMKYLKPTTIPIGYLQSVPRVPKEPVETYTVTTYLVGRRDLDPQKLSLASRLFEKQTPLLTGGILDATFGETSEMLQGVEAFMGILVNIVVGFLALLGYETLTYRKRFHNLNSLVSLISMHQSSKDVLATPDPKRRAKNLLYLGLCSDLLGLISAISSYYTQENSSLLFNTLPEIIHSRCDGLKINIQLKILHATIGDISLEDDIPSKPETASQSAAQPPATNRTQQNPA